MLESSAKILRKAIDETSPTYVVSMVSGGRDSAASHAVAQELGVKIDLTIHGRTGTGIPDTTAWVQDRHGRDGSDLAIADAGSAYEDYVMRKGFFGKGREAHNFAYRVLKATPFRKVISAELRKRRRGVKILLINGARAEESKNRKKNLPVMRSDPAAPGNIWINPIHYWVRDDRDDYLASRNVPINPVAKALCKSGECMCGTMQTKQERAEASVLYPAWGNWLDKLEAEARKVHGFGWSDPFPRQHDPRQIELFQPMCTGCAHRAETISTANI